MIKAFLPYIYTGAIVTATGGLGYLLAEKNGLIDQEPPAKVALLQPEVETPTQPKIVEPQVEILDGETVIATTQSATNGDFVVVLDTPLKPGPHSLIIRAKPKEGEEVFSAEAGLINIPEPEKQEEVTVLVAEADKPTRILQKPEPEAVVEAEEQTIVSETATASVALAKPDAKEPEVEVKQEVAKLEVEPAAEPEIKEPEVEEVVEEPAEDEAVKVVETPKPAEVEQPSIPVLIEAADVEKNRIFIAGKGEAGRSVNLYLNSKFLGSARVSSNNAFLYEGNERLKAGQYDLRADMIDIDTGKVVARAEVSLLHEPKEEPAPVQVVEAVSEPEPQPQQELKPEPIEQEQTAAINEAVEQSEPAIEATEIAEVEPAEIKVEETVEEVAEAAVEETTEQAIEEKAVIKTGSSVIIRRGDNLWTVASRNYGEGIRYTTIFDAEKLADQLKALGHPVRLQIVQELKCMESCNCGDMCDCFAHSQSTISQHLSVLKDAGILRYKKDGNQSRFSLNHEVLDELQKALEALSEPKPRVTCK